MAPDFQLPVMKIIGSRGLFVEGLIVFRQVVFSRNVVVVDLQGLNRFMAGEFRHGQQVVRKQLNQLCREIMPEAVSAVVDIQIFQKGSHDIPNRFRGQFAVLIIITVADEQGTASHLAIGHIVFQGFNRTRVQVDWFFVVPAFAVDERGHLPRRNVLHVKPDDFDLSEPLKDQ